VAKLERPLKIGFVLDGGLEKPDGVQQYILGLGEWYKSQGHKVRYIVAGPIAPGIEDAVSLARSLHVVSNGNRLSIPLPTSTRRIKAYLRQEQFDVLHIQTPYSPMMGAKLIKYAGPKTAIIGTFHVMPNRWVQDVGNSLLGIWCHSTLKRFDHMFSVSRPAQAFAKRTFKMDSDICPNVIDVARYRSAKALDAYRDGKVNILFFGRLVPRKGCKTLLEAVSQLSQAEKDSVQVIVCGDGPQLKSLKSFVKSQSIDGIVDFKGFIPEDNKARYYASAHIAVFPSSGGESFGIVLLEAMASGKSTVLAGNNPGYASVMSERPNLLFEPNDVQSLVWLLKRYINNPTERYLAANWAKKYVEQFDIPVVAARIEAVYREALLKRRVT
jgi:phosphatidylinositol alpha-mannosyltransferase